MHALCVPQVRACFDEVVATEASRGLRYAWLMRARTDLVHLPQQPTPTFLAELPPTHAYVPMSTSMSSFPLAKCQNDHLFLCPRRLCRPYFTGAVRAHRPCAGPDQLRRSDRAYHAPG